MTVVHRELAMWLKYDVERVVVQFPSASERVFGIYPTIVHRMADVSDIRLGEGVVLEEFYGAVLFVGRFLYPSSDEFTLLQVATRSFGFPETYFLDCCWYSNCQNEAF